MKKLFILVSNLLKTQNIYITKSLSYFGKRHMLLPPNMDFVRAAVLELCVYEIKLKNLEGNVSLNLNLGRIIDVKKIFICHQQIKNVKKVFYNVG